MKKSGFYLVLFIFLFKLSAKAQYISTSETVPYVCPSVCASGTLVLKIFQLQNLTSGAQVQAVLSNSTGGFGSGTATISCNRYSTVSATGPWINGPYTFSSNASNVFFEFTIPAATVPASGYTVHFKSGATIGANMQMPCTGFTVTPSYAPLTALAPSTAGAGQWIAHAYTWTPTTGAILNTAALVAAQSFFNPANYKGHFIKNSLSFDINYTPNGGKMPGPVNVLHDGTSFSCGDGYSTNYSLQFLRTENFAPGLYQLEIQGDDGIRLSIDGGITWLLNSFLEQPYATSLKTTATLFPNGVCLSGATPLVIEYFQRPADARIRFAATLLSSTALSQPTDSIICAGQSAAFTTSSISGASYQWQVSSNGGASFTPLTNVAPYSGATSNSLQISAATTLLNTYLYNCVVSGVCTNPVTTANAMLSVTTAAPTILTQPTNSVTCDLGTATFTVSNNGTALYQWQRDSSGIFVNIHNIPPFSNVNTGTLTISPANSSLNNSSYQCLITGCGVTIASNIVTLSVTPNAIITSQPQPLSLCAGDPASFSVTASNAVSYQWQENTGAGFVNISNGGIYSNSTTATLSISAVNASMTGNQYQCVATGCGSGLSSSNVTLTVGANAIISTQPIDNSLCLGANGTFTIGIPSGLTCQWQINTGSGFSNIVNNATYSGATTATLSINSMQAAMNNHQFQCIVSGCASSSITSNVVTLFLGTSATINTQPASVVLCGSGNTSFTVGASNAQSFQWQVNSGSGFTNLANGGIYTNVNAATLNLIGANLTQNGNLYQCVITSCAGTSLVTNAVTLQVQALAAISNQPLSQSVCVGATATFTCTATNAQSLTWNGGFGGVLSPLVTGGNISISGNTITIINVSAAQNNYQLNCTITDCSGNIVSNTVSLAVTPAVSITSSGAAQTICDGDNALLSVVASNAISYQWEVNTGTGFTSISNGTVYSNATTANLSITNAGIALSGNLYRCLVNGCGTSSAASTPNGLTVLPVSNLVSQTPSAIICEGAGTSLSINTSSAASYQWQVNSGTGFINLTDGGIYSGTSTAVLSISNAGMGEDGNIYQCIFTSCGPSKNSAPIPFTVESLPTILEHPKNETKCEDESAAFVVAASGTNLSNDGCFTFSNLQNNSSYAGVNSSTLILKSILREMNTYFFRCAIDGCGQTVFSDPAQIEATENAQQLFIPNAFSPDNDGLNDFFYVPPYGLKSIKGLIFDRWGELVFEWNSLTSKWDGRYRGEQVPLGVYVYTIEATGTCADQKLEKKGTISIIK